MTDLTKLSDEELFIKITFIGINVKAREGYSQDEADIKFEYDRRLKNHIGLRPFPKIVCLCGSTRFMEAFQKANLNETLKGNIVLSIGCDFKSDEDLFSDMTPEEKQDLKDRLDELHLRKIDLAYEVFILNVGGYIGESTRKELEYAISKGKAIKFLELTNEQ